MTVAVLLVGESCFVEGKSTNGEKRKTARRTAAGGRTTLATGRDGHSAHPESRTHTHSLTICKSYKFVLIRKCLHTCILRFRMHS